MDFTIKRGPLHQEKTPCLILAVHTGKKLSEAAQNIDKRSRGLISRVLKRGDIGGKAGDVLLLPEASGISAERILLVGMGRSGQVDQSTYIRAVKAAAAALVKHGFKNALSTLLDVSVSDVNAEWITTMHTRLIASAAYRFNEFKSKPKAGGLTRFAYHSSVHDAADLRDRVKRARAIADGMALSRNLGNRPGNVCTPTHLAEVALELANGNDVLNCEVLEEAEMEALGMGSLLSVSRGSREPAKLIIMHYQGAADDVKPVVLVGKGVTFDSGGISIKPGPGMDEMKYDMCGAASVIGTMAAIAAIKPAMNVVGMVPATENLPDGNASKPGDIVTSMSGQTIEILNTDAEGRLILCDALTYAARFEPDVVIDIATLTGACVVALGEHASGLMSNDDELADELLAAGQRIDDRAWRLPIWEEYQRQIDSPFADMANVGGRAAGSVTAGCFLARFTRDYRWAHLDIAGTAWHSGKNKTASGRPVPLLTEFILARQRS